MLAIQPPCMELRMDGARLEGWVHSVETMGTVDGPGLRYVLFLNGCPLRCAYCHNPDTMRKCDGNRTTVAEVLQDLDNHAAFYRQAGGGFTISGGEPLMQPAFTREILKGAKTLGLHTALDTSGFLGRHADDELLAHTDLVLLDVKSGIPEVYRRVTERPLQPTLDFARRLDAMGKPVWLRFVLVPGLTDGEDNVAAVARIAASLGNVEKVEILPFHKMGEPKWQALGLKYRLVDTPEPSVEQVEIAKRIFEEAGCPVG